MKTIRDTNKKRLFSACADLIQFEMRSSNKNKLCVGLVGGSSVKRLYSEIAKNPDKDAWKKAEVFFLDERLVPRSSRYSNQTHVDKLLIQPLIKKKVLKKSQVHYFDTSKPEKSITDYNKILKSLGGKIDCAILSIGKEGHEASIFDNTEDKKAYFELIHTAPKKPKDRMTITPKALSKITTAFTLVLGKEKKTALRKIIMHSNSTPTNALLSIRNIYLFTDQEES